MPPVQASTTTGSGMLILLGELAQGHGPVLYVAPDNYLVSQQRLSRTGPKDTAGGCGRGPHMAGCDLA
jgi:hypothetical protein